MVYSETTVHGQRDVCWCRLRHMQRQLQEQQFSTCPILFLDQGVEFAYEDACRERFILGQASSLSNSPSGKHSLQLCPNLTQLWPSRPHWTCCSMIATQGSWRSTSVVFIKHFWQWTSQKYLGQPDRHLDDISALGPVLPSLHRSCWKEK
jgi:hypothetical protein